MRTNHLCEFEAKISELNNHLSHTVFVFKQFIIDNATKTVETPDEFTTTVYTTNEFAQQFNVKLRDIDKQAEKSLDYILDTLFVFTNTQFEVYLKDVYLFAKNNSQLQLAEPPDSKVYETILARIGVNLDTDIDNLFVSTYDYFKYRRNAIMHRDKGKRFHGAMEDLIKGKNPNSIFRKQQLNGQQLILEWKRYTKSLDDNNLKGYTVRNFDFADREISNFSLADLFNIFNFYRLYARTIDKLILERIERGDLLKYILQKHQKKYGYKKEQNLQEFIVRFNRTNKLELNLNLTTQEINDIFNHGI